MMRKVHTSNFAVYSIAAVTDGALKAHNTNNGQNLNLRSSYLEKCPMQEVFKPAELKPNMAVLLRTEADDSGSWTKCWSLGRVLKISTKRTISVCWLKPAAGSTLPADKWEFNKKPCHLSDHYECMSWLASWQDTPSVLACSRPFPNDVHWISVNVSL